MSNAILVIGESGTGKSTSLRNLNPKETSIINVLNKPLPFRGYKSKYIQKTGGNYGVSDNPEEIVAWINKMSQARFDIKNIIIDDFQYIMANEYMRRAKEVGFQKFTDIGMGAYKIIEVANKVRDDINVFILSHCETNKQGLSKLKTIGEMTDKITVMEGRFTVVLHTHVVDGNYKFITQNNGSVIAKSPLGMFDDLMIDNDLQYVSEKINQYYNEELEEEILESKNEQVFQDEEKLISNT